MTTAPQLPGLLTSAEAAKLLRVDPQTVRKFASRGRLESLRTAGGHRRYKEAEVLALRNALLPTEPGEEWRPAVGYEGKYEVSSFGRVRSLPGSCRHVGVRAQYIDPYSGYPTVSLQGPTRTWRVHRLVGDAFLGPRPAGMEIRPLDGVKTNSHVGNLAYGTSSENKLDLYYHRAHPGTERRAS